MTPFIGKSNAANEQASIIRFGIERLSSTTNLILVSTFLIIELFEIVNVLFKEK